MSKFKVGDVVITNRFEAQPNFSVIDGMEEFFGREGKIDCIGDYLSRIKIYLVHDWFWPESALTLVKSADENKD